MRESDVAAKILLRNLPVSIRTALLRDESFQCDLGLNPAFHIRLDKSISVETRSLHNALRKAVAGKSSGSITLSSGKRSRAKLGRGAKGEATLVVDDHRFSFKDADLLEKGAIPRLVALDRVFSERPLSAKEEALWRSIAESRGFTDDEYVDLMTALTETPESLAAKLQEPQKLSAEVLMPRETGYYDRLTAKIETASTADEFISNELAAERRSLLEKHPRAAIRRIAFTNVAPEFSAIALSGPVDAPHIEALLSAEDPNSLMFGFELCCEAVERNRSVAPIGEAFLKKLLGGNSLRRYQVFSACALVAMGEIRRSASAPDAPTFWARHAALAHAGVLADALQHIPDAKGFWEWSVEAHYALHHWQGIVDKRQAPSWQTDWISPEVIHAQMFRRVSQALYGVPNQFCPASWKEYVDAVRASLEDSGDLIDSLFDDPFVDFFVRPARPVASGPFAEIEADLIRAKRLDDVPGLAALAYVVSPLDEVLANAVSIVRGDGLPTENSIADLHHLRILTHMALVSASEELALAIIEKCLQMAASTLSRIPAPDLLATIVEACAVHRDLKAYFEAVQKHLAALAMTRDEEGEITLLLEAIDLLNGADFRLTPALAKARGILRTRLGRL